jgi:hypothetical protein
MAYPPQVFNLPMTALGATGNASVTFDLGRPRPFLCWVSITMIDSLSSFDRDNAVAADIFTIDGIQQPTRVFGGDHFGSNGSASNLMPGVRVGFGRTINCWLRVFHISDLEAYGEAVVMALD